VNRIKNNHFSFYDFKLYVLMLYMFNEKISWNHINIKDISKVANYCSKKQYEKDGVFIEQLLNKLDMDKSVLYEVNSNGNNILLDLIIEGKIYPTYYLLNYNVPDEYFHNSKYDISDLLSLINIRTKTIKKILRR